MLLFFLFQFIDTMVNINIMSVCQVSVITYYNYIDVIEFLSL